MTPSDTTPISEMTPEQRAAALCAALDEGAIEELPPNVPPGLLGEVNPSLKKVDGDGPHGLNAGLTDEWTYETTMLTVVILWMVFFPAAYWVLWSSRRVPRMQKIVFSVVMAVGVALAVWQLFFR